MAKKKSKKSGGTTEAPAKAKKKAKTAITFVKKRKATRRRNPDSGGSVALMMVDLASQAVPVVVTFAGTHVVSHIVGDRLLGGRSWSKHLKVLTAFTAIAGAYFAGRTRALEKYQTGMVIGSTLAALQTLLQAYVPQFAWILGSTPGVQYQQLQQVQQQVQQQVAAPSSQNGDDDDLSDLQGLFAPQGSSGWNADLS